MRKKLFHMTRLCHSERSACPEVPLILEGSRSEESPDERQILHFVQDDNKMVGMTGNNSE